MRHFCTVSKATFDASRHMFAEAHFLDLPNGRIVLCADFLGENHLRRFLSASDVRAFPHPLTGQAVGAAIAAELAAFSISATDSTVASVLKLAATHPLMNLGL